MRKNILAIAVTLGVLGAAMSSRAAEAILTQNITTVKSISYLKLDQGLEVTVRIDGEFLNQILVLSNPNRLVVDVAPAQRIEAQPYYEVNVFNLTSIRTGQFTPSIARVIFDFSGPIPAYEIRKTETGFTVRFTMEEKKVETPVAPPITVQPPPAVKETKAEVRKETVETGEREFPGFYNTSLGITLGTFQSPSQDFRDIYGAGTDTQLGLNLTRTLLYVRGFQLDVALEARTYSKTGYALLDGEKTNIATEFSMRPVTLSGRLLYQTKYIVPFVGAGADWYSFDEKSELQNTSGKASGYHFQAGLYLLFPWYDRLRIKLFYKYTKATASASGFDIALGGNEYGLGLSLAFNLFKKGVLSF